MILAHKPDVDVHDDGDRTPLQWAIFHRSLTAVKLLIEAKCSLEQSTTSKPKPLFMAIDEHCPDIVRLLADSGAELHGTELTYSALHRASSVGDAGVLNVLMERSEVLKDVQVQHDSDGCTPLHYLAEVTNDDIITAADAMIAAGATISVEDAKGNTPLHHAAKAGSLVMVKRLVNAGAVIEAQNQQGKTPSDVANAKQHKEIVAFLGGTFKKKWHTFDRTESFKLDVPSMKLDGKMDGLKSKFKRTSIGK